MQKLYFHPASGQYLAAGMAFVLGDGDDAIQYPANWLDAYTVGDFNSDGKTDIWWITKAGVTGVWTIDGANTWNADAMHSPFTGWTTVDNNGDGKADVAFQHTVAGGAIQWNALSIPEQTIPPAPVGPDMPTAPPVAPPPTSPTPPIEPVSPPVIPTPPPPDWGM